MFQSSSSNSLFRLSDASTLDQLHITLFDCEAQTVEMVTFVRGGDRSYVEIRDLRPRTTRIEKTQTHFLFENTSHWKFNPAKYTVQVWLSEESDLCTSSRAKL